MITDIDKLKIHQALHDKSAKEVEVNGVIFPIEVHTNGCRCTVINHTEFLTAPAGSKVLREQKNVFMAQNPNKGTEGALLARKGEALTWDINIWELMMDGKVYKENTKQVIHEKAKKYL